MQLSIFLTSLALITARCTTPVPASTAAATTATTQVAKPCPAAATCLSCSTILCSLSEQAA
jgi:hypothetical protein